MHLSDDAALTVRYPLRLGKWRSDQCRTSEFPMNAV